MQRILTLAAFCCLFIVACKKDKADPVATAKTNLTAHKWKLSSAVQVTSSGEQPVALTPCRTDDIFEYKADGTFTLYPGTSLCTSGQTNTVGTWELQTNATQLKVSSNGNYYVDDIKELTGTKLRLGYSIGTSNYIETYIPY
jgi:hypothetical protein